MFLLMPYLIGAFLIIVGAFKLRDPYGRGIGSLAILLGVLILWRYHTWLTGG